MPSKGLKPTPKPKKRRASKPPPKPRPVVISTPNKPSYISDSKEEYARIMNCRQDALRVACMSSKSEQDAYKIILGMTDLKCTRQAQWGNRFYDFWFPAKFIAIEIDGQEHRKDFDEIRDRYNYLRSGILVFRALNGDLNRVAEIMGIVNSARPVSYRKNRLGILKVTEGGRGVHHLLHNPKEAARVWDEVRVTLDPTRFGTKQPDFKLNDGNFLKASFDEF